jgi:hypothetical protein
MTRPINAYAATAPRASLEPFSYDPGGKARYRIVLVNE